MAQNHFPDGAISSNHCDNGIDKVQSGIMGDGVCMWPDTAGVGVIGGRWGTFPLLAGQEA